MKHPQFAEMVCTTYYFGIQFGIERIMTCLGPESPSLGLDLDL